jgi:putative acetyltransferase
MILVRTNSEDEDFINLVKSLDEYLATMDGEEHPFYAKFNTLDEIKYVMLAFEGDECIGCGAIKEFEPGVMEVKRMFTKPGSRGRGTASEILTGLEQWTAELGGVKCILETGKRQVEAVRLYKRMGYKQIPNYGQYAGMENSLCFEKEL